MAVLQKIRVKFGLAISIIIALALLSFIIDPNTLESALQSMSSKYDVGKIAGKRVSYTDFQENVDKFTTINQIATGSSVQDENTQTQIRNAAWQDFLDRYMFIENAKAAGIRVDKDELYDLLMGSNISPVVEQNRNFAGEDGKYSPEVFQEFVQNAKSDESGRLNTFWNYIQSSVVTQKYYEKYEALLNNSSYMPKVFTDLDIAETNTTVDVEYVPVPFDYKDSTIVVSAKEIQNYYNAHKKEYKQKASRDIEYVVFEVEPSADDVARMAEDMVRLQEEFSAASNVRNFLVKSGSDKPYSERWYSKDELSGNFSSEIADFAFSGSNEVSPIYRSGNLFRVVKTMGSAVMPGSVFVKHIFFRAGNPDAQANADAVMAELKKGGDFAALAAQYSDDKSSASDGSLGSLGWMSQVSKIDGFEPCFSANINKPFVLDSPYGKHVVVVTDRRDVELRKQVAVLEKKAVASNETQNNCYAQANRFASIAGGTLEGYLRAVDSTGVYSHKANRITESTSSFGGVSHAKQITRWAFDAKPGKASEIITIDNNYFFIAALKAVREDGFTPVNEVAATIHETLRSEQLKLNTCKKVAEKIAGLTDLEAVAEACKGSVASREGVSFSVAGGTPALEPAFLGAVSKAPEGEICGPVAGEACVYVFKLSNRKTGSFYTEDDAKAEAEQKARYASQMIIPVMTEAAGVIDNRPRFY
ncbi:MAG: SurA N-terminal domain-containing protein [Bacteroidales bacterium]|nr:SurA N-terminal domain-containing protein [Bacteroidales bacterium]